MDNTPQANYTTKEAARYLRMAESTLEKWRVTGDGPVFVKLNKSVRYRKPDLDRFQNESARTSTSRVKG